MNKSRIYRYTKIQRTKKYFPLLYYIVFHFVKNPCLFANCAENKIRFVLNCSKSRWLIKYDIVDDETL